ncbi:hypothetical protein ID866_3593 [Astraeus odoratus]|nr:hypothetical protein ID866_3593 [Astraeus odoratus]
MITVELRSTIEIVPGDGSVFWSPTGSDKGPYHPFLLVDDNLGVPQKVLYKLYLQAIGIFNTARSILSSSRGGHQIGVNGHPTELLLVSTSVIVLANPAHETALNARKRLVLEGAINPHDELRLTASLLSSQHCVKHSELWYHRRWLLSFLSEPVDVDTSRDTYFCMPPADLRREVALASRACELYPRNYFAWMHRLICFRSFAREYLVGHLRKEFGCILDDEVADIKRWIELHVSDHSAVQYLISLCRTCTGHHDLHDMYEGLHHELHLHAISLVRTYPSHESLWMYVHATSSLSDTCRREDLKDFLEGFVRPLARQGIDGLLRDHQGPLHASRFLAKEPQLSWFEPDPTTGAAP